MFLTFKPANEILEAGGNSCKGFSAVVSCGSGYHAVHIEQFLQRLFQPLSLRTLDILKCDDSEDSFLSSENLI